jgi:hypothetical protein
VALKACCGTSTDGHWTLCANSHLANGHVELRRTPRQTLLSA